MKKSILFFVKYYLFWLIFFFSFKVFFLILNKDYTSTLSLSDIFKVFLHGSVMDFSSAGYLSLLPGLVFSVLPFVKEKIIARIISCYTLIILVIVVILGLMDSALYASWGIRLNAQILMYFKNLGGMWASMSGWLWLLTFIIWTAIVFGFYKLLKRWMNFSNSASEKPRWYISPLMLFLTAVLIIPIRGGLDRSPLNHSSVYFSEKVYANHAAYNYFWTFMYAISHQDENKCPINYMDEKACLASLKGVDTQNQKNYPIYIKNKTGKPTNVILVILESFSNKVIEPLGGLKAVTPNINKFCKEGILFSNCYAAGSRSDRGISALLCAYPALIKASAIMNFPDKLKNADFMPQYFKKHQYDMSFYYGGDVNFYNTRMLLIQSGVNHIVSKEDYPLSAAKQKWGVPDELLYQRMFNDLQKSKKPFLSMVYNISSHEPFDIPNKYKKIKGEDAASLYCNSVAYGDSCLGDFIAKLKKSPMWNNTLVIITSDHAILQPGPTGLEDLESFRIPLIWMGGVIDTSFVVEHPVMQSDVSATLVQQMGWKPKPSYFSRNMFGKEDYALFHNIDGWGFVSPQCAYYENVESNQSKFFYGADYAKKDSLLHFAKAYTQHLHNDFQKK